MKIGEVAARTGLTRKAIRYYEEEGLVRPREDPWNSYRDYSEEDVERLQHIAVLRDAGLGVSEIRQILDGEEDPLNLLRACSLRLRDQAARLQEQALLLEGSLGGATAPAVEPGTRVEKIRRVCARLKALRETARADAGRTRRGYLARELRRLFPGPFGAMVSLLLGPFLEEPLDTPEKTRAWASLVSYLDGMGELRLPEDLMRELAAAAPAFEGAEEELRRKVDALLELPPAEVQRLRGAATEPRSPSPEEDLIARLFTSGEVVRVLATVEGHLAALSPRFGRFLERMLEVAGLDPSAVARLRELAGGTGAATGAAGVAPPEVPRA